jgi:signal peptidase
MTHAQRAAPRVARATEKAVAVASIGFALVSVYWVAASLFATGIVFVAAMVAGSLPLVLDAFVSRHDPESPSPFTSAQPRSVTTVVHVGAEPLDLVRAAVVLAERQGPTVVVTSNGTDLASELELPNVAVYVAPSSEEALSQAAAEIATDAVLLVSPRAIPIVANCELVAGALGEGVGWVIGTASPFREEGYAPQTREVLNERLRASARRSGLTTWERDATIVRTTLLRELPLDPQRPWGRWLRTMQARGHRGVCAPTPVSVRAVPAGASTFWPATMARQRGFAADLADATTVGPPRARVLAAGLLLRELYAYPLIVWVLAPLIVALSAPPTAGGSATVFFGVQAILGTARWLALRWAHRVRPRPVTDALAVLYEAPGSMFALLGALTRTTKPARMPLPRRPLVWATLALAIATTIPLLDRRRLGDSIEVTLGLAIADLCLLWVLALRLIAQWKWERATLRLPSDLSVTVDGSAARTVDLSPSGVAVIGTFPVLEPASPVSLDFRLSDGSNLEASGLVINRRAAGEQEILGLTIDVRPEDRPRWILEAYADPRIGVLVPRGAHPGEFEGSDVPRGIATSMPVLDKVALAAGALCSLLLMSAIVLVIAGYQPLVVRTNSMNPTLAAGDLIVVADEVAGDLHVGDIVTIDDGGPTGESITHRVRRISASHGQLTVETRGDANAASEFWKLDPSSPVGQFEGRVPDFGSIVLWITTPDARTALVLIALALALVWIVLARSRHRRTMRSTG